MTTPTTLPLPSDEDDFFTHPVCDMYESNRNGVVRNIKSGKEVGSSKNNEGYYRFTCRCCADKDKKFKNYLNHRFIYECHFGLIEDGYVCDHINNIKTDNRLENLQMITKSENSKKDYKKRDTRAIKIRAINVETGEIFIYRSQKGAAVDLHIHSSSISYVLKGKTKTALSKKYNERYTFQKVDSETSAPVIIINNNKYINNIKINTAKKVNIPIEQVKKMIVNNNN